MTAVLYMRNGTKILLDEEDYEEMSKKKWHNAAGYATATEHYYKNGKRTMRSVLMHRLINKTPDGLYTDHINGNKLDNRKCNLRTATNRQNQYNRASDKDALCKYKGVSKSSKNRWRAVININGSDVHIGSFKNIEDAATAYNLMAAIHYGEYAFYNKFQEVA